MVPYDNKDSLEDIGVFYDSTSDRIKVDKNGNVSTSAEGGEGDVIIRTSEGNEKKIHVVIFDDTPPEISVNDEMPEDTVQYEKIVLPEISSTDTSGFVENYVQIIYPEDRIISGETVNGKEVFSFTPKDYGEYCLRFVAADAKGNEAYIEKVMLVSQASANDDFYVLNSTYSYATPVYNGNEATLQGRVGSLTAVSAEKSVLVYSNPVTFYKKPDGTYTDVTFDVLLDWGTSELASVGSPYTDFTRYFSIMLNEVELKESGQIDSNYFSNGKNGIQLLLGKAVATETQNDFLRYELYSGVGRLSAQHMHVIDCEPNATADQKAAADEARNGVYANGDEVFVDFQYGQALNFARAINTKQYVSFKIEYIEKDDNYILTAGDLKFRVPANSICSTKNDFSKQAYLGFVMYSQDGYTDRSISVKNICNGTVKNIRFDKGMGGMHKVGDSFLLTPFSIMYEGSMPQDNVYEFSSSDEKIATVDATGNVKVIGVGSCVISATASYEGKAAQYLINVGVDSLRFAQDKLTVAVGSSLKLDCISDPPCDLISYSSENSEIAAVLRDGTIQAVKPGKVIIIAQYLDKTAQIEVEVVEKLPSAQENGCSASFEGTQRLIGCLFIATVSLILLKKLREAPISK